MSIKLIQALADGLHTEATGHTTTTSVHLSPVEVGNCTQPLLVRVQHFSGTPFV